MKGKHKRKRENRSQPKPPRQHPANTDKPKDTTTYPNQTTPRDQSVIPQVPPTPRNPIKTNSAGKDDTPMWKKWFDVAAFCLALAVAAIYYCQLKSMQASVDLARSTAQIDQRPYVWDNNVKPGVSVEANQRMWANISMINYGKSPALKTRMTGPIFIGQTAMADADRWFAQFGNNPFTDPNESETVVPPGIPTPVQPFTDADKLPKVPAGEVRAEVETFGGGGMFTVFSDNVLKQSDVDYVLEPKNLRSLWRTCNTTTGLVISIAATFVCLGSSMATCLIARITTKYISPVTASKIIHVVQVYNCPIKP
jgi:hypothetical protein